MVTRIPLQRVRSRYNAVREMWPRADYWHYHLFTRYPHYLAAYKPHLEAGLCLNIGSASNNYAINDDEMIYFDAAEHSLPANRMSLCGDAHHLPFGDGSFCSAMAIGSVINYCSPAEIFTEVHRITSSGSYFIFDFEQIGGFEHMNRIRVSSKAEVFHTEYNNDDEVIWLYALDHILQLLTAIGFKVRHVHHIHVASSAAWLLTENNLITAALCKIDFLFERLPIIRRGSSTVLIVAQK